MDAIAKIHEFEKFGSILGLERMTSLMHELGDPQDDLKCIHVAGTNGKGSVCKYVYEILEAQGYRTGLYTSPFLEVFNERIELDHEFISDEDLQTYTDRVLEKVKVLTDRGEDSPTEFEVITAVAFLYFKEKKADYVVLEVGLGGIGDSTNLIKEPLVSVITSISFDHTDRLGNTLAEIAGNKAGIIKP
ncbi:MAG: bifunctional folylpolyglutamate synthase/dihydrofolate synthase, partial [Firmicutes bacterium]|nr:bifunctional folylpolyglutamate synthase/dihydrofolate synthase [Bacillota bacterium]